MTKNCRYEPAPKLTVIMSSGDLDMEKKPAQVAGRYNGQMEDVP